MKIRKKSLSVGFRRPFAKRIATRFMEFVLFTKYYWIHQIEKNEIGGACKKNRRYEKFIKL
jgi:hypothetical protein